MDVIDDGGLVVQDPGDAAVYNVDWSEHFDASVNLTDSQFSLTVLSGTAGLATDSSAKTGLITQIRVVNPLGPVLKGSLFQVTNQVTTDETPAQTKQRSWQILIEDL